MAIALTLEKRIQIMLKMCVLLLKVQLHSTLKVGSSVSFLTIMAYPLSLHEMSYDRVAGDKASQNSKSQVTMKSFLVVHSCRVFKNLIEVPFIVHCVFEDECFKKLTFCSEKRNQKICKKS